MNESCGNSRGSVEVKSMPYMAKVTDVGMTGASLGCYFTKETEESKINPDVYGRIGGVEGWETRKSDGLDNCESC